MLRVQQRIDRGYGLGQAEPRIYGETGDCGVIGSDNARPCRTWTYSNLASALPNGGTVRVGRTEVYYGTPRQLFDRLGVCAAVSQAFGSGLDVPGPQGITHIETGVFHPRKSWQQMFEESQRLSSGNDYQICAFGYGGSTDLAKHRIANPDQQVGFALYDSSGNVMCAQGGDTYFGIIPKAGGVVSSITVPDRYKGSSIVAQTAAMWMSDYPSKQGQPVMFCDNVGDWAPVRDPDFLGHAYQQRTVRSAKIGASGVVSGPITLTEQQPVIEGFFPDDVSGLPNTQGGPAVVGAFIGTLVGYASGGGYLGTILGFSTFAVVKDTLGGVAGLWVGFTPAQVRAARLAGKWPPSRADLPATAWRWYDDKSPAQPAQVTSAPPPPGYVPPAQKTSSTAATVLGVAGIIAGVIFIGLAARERSR